MKESIFYSCFLTTIIILCVGWFVELPRVSMYSQTYLEKECYEYLSEAHYYNQSIAMTNQIRMNCPIGIVKFDFDKNIPIKAYLADGQVKDIKWEN